MKSMTLVIVLLGFMLSVSGCSDDPPLFRVRNDRPTKANVQIKTTGGNTININDVQPGVTTNSQSAEAGLIEATATIQDEQTSPSISFYADKGESYTIVVVNVTPPVLEVTSP